MPLSGFYVHRTGLSLDYFNTYKLLPGQENKMSISAEEDPESAMRIIESSMADYREFIAAS